MIIENVQTDFCWDSSRNLVELLKNQSGQGANGAKRTRHGPWVKKTKNVIKKFSGCYYNELPDIDGEE